MLTTDSMLGYFHTKQVLKDKIIRSNKKTLALKSNQGQTGTTQKFSVLRTVDPEWLDFPAWRRLG